MAQTTTTSTPTVGTVIRAWRVFRGLSSKALAEKASVRSGYLSEIENDKKRNPWLDHLEKLAVALEISLQDIQDRRLPPGQGEEDDQAGGQGPFPGIAQSPQPQVTAVVGSVLQQLLEQVQALTAAVSQLQADLADLTQRTAIPSPATQARSGDTVRVVRAVQIDDLTGHWEGNTRLYLPEKTPLTVVSATGERMVTPRDMTFLIALHLWLERASEAELSGHGQVTVALLPLGGEFVKAVIISHVSIRRGIVEDDQITLTFQSIEETPLVFMTGTLSRDGRLLTGGFEAEGLLTEQRVGGKFSLEKAGEQETMQVFLAEPLRRVAGHWEGSAQQKLPEGTRVTCMFSSESLEKVIKVPRPMTISMAMRLTLWSTWNTMDLYGAGELDIALSELGVEEARTVSVNIRGELVEPAGWFRIRLLNSEDASVRLYMDATLRDDGRTLSGEYHVERLFTAQTLRGEFALERVGAVYSSEEEYIRVRDFG
jgi:transcriptional regulator with XRE-family HTH domain